MATNDAESSKFLGYAVEGPTTTAAESSKFLGYASESPPVTGVQVAKALGYADLAPPVATSSKLLSYAILAPQPASMAVAVTESPDTVAAALTVTNAVGIGIIEAPDAVYVQLGYNVVINIASEEADHISVVLNNPGSWAECTDKNTAWTECSPAAPTVWTECTPKAPTFWCPEPRKNRRRKKKWS